MKGTLMVATLNDNRLPAGYNTLNPFVLGKGPGGAAGFIGFLEKVFGGVERANVRTLDRDGSVLHAEVRVGNSSLLLADSKAGWPFTPAFEQIHVENIPAVLERAEAAGAEIVTPRSPFYNGVNIARILDPWGTYGGSTSPKRKPKATRRALRPTPPGRIAIPASSTRHSWT